MHKVTLRQITVSAIAVMAMAVPTAADNIVGQTAVLRALDKVTATTQDFKVKVGDTLTYGSLNITVKHCEKEPPEEIPETYVFVQITERSLDSNEQANEPAKLFSGWMFGSDPAMSALEHPVYDVWPIACNEPTGLRGVE